VVFDHAYTNGPETQVALPSLFASIPPAEAAGRLRPSENAVEYALAELFSSAGYDTAAFQANHSLGRSLGYDRGFDTYEVFRKPGPAWANTVDAATLHRSVVEWLRRPRERPFFLLVQSMDTHAFYAPPEPFRGKFSQSAAPPPPKLAYAPNGLEQAELEFLAKAAASVKPHHYDDAVAYLDHELGTLLDRLAELGLRDSTVVVLTSDHGESLGDGGRFLHGMSLNEELVRIPLMISLPGVPGSRSSAVVSLMDLGPTLLDLAGIPIPAQFRGLSLLRSHERHAARSASGERIWKRESVEWYLREGPYKLLVREGGGGLFRVAEDRAEADDLSARLPVQKAYLASRLAQELRSYAEQGFRALPPDMHLSDEERREREEALRALGYVE
jgi:arylsulfatase A-like enzyme